MFSGSVDNYDKITRIKSQKIAIMVASERALQSEEDTKNTLSFFYLEAE